ncbi:MAG: alpha/beta hydrolase [Pseudomonadota bacterium]
MRDRFEFHNLRVDGLSIRVMDRLDASDEIPLIVCNGIGQSCETVQPFLKHVSGRRVISFDAVGAGKSDCAETHLSMEEHAQVLHGVMDELGIEQADIMGISWGGALAQQLVRAYPDRCRRLILALTSPGGALTLTGHPMATTEIFVPMRRYSKEWTRFITPIMYGGRAMICADELDRYSMRNVIPSLKGYFGQISAMMTWSSMGWLHEIKHKTLIYSGLFDPLIPFWNQKLLADHIPNSELRVFPTGHWLVYEERVRLAAEIETFLA